MLPRHLLPKNLIIGTSHFSGQFKTVRSRVRPPDYLSRDTFPRHFVTEAPRNRDATLFGSVQNGEVRTDSVFLPLLFFLTTADREKKLRLCEPREPLLICVGVSGRKPPSGRPCLRFAWGCFAVKTPVWALLSWICLGMFRGENPRLLHFCLGFVRGSKIAAGSVRHRARPSGSPPSGEGAGVEGAGAPRAGAEGAGGHLGDPVVQRACALLAGAGPGRWGPARGRPARRRG